MKVPTGETWIKLMLGCVVVVAASCVAFMLTGAVVLLFLATGFAILGCFCIGTYLGQQDRQDRQ